MHIESLACNNCGAPITVPESANYATCAHCGSQLVIRRTDTAHYTEVLQRLDERSEQMTEDLETIRLQNEIEQLDREWMIEREKYRIQGRRGSSSLPTSTTIPAAIVGGIVVIGFAAVWMMFASMISGPFFFFPLFGLVFIGVALVAIISSITKADSYTRAEQEYLRKREALLRRLQERR